MHCKRKYILFVLVLSCLAAALFGCKAIKPQHPKFTPYYAEHTVAPYEPGETAFLHTTAVSDAEAEDMPLYFHHAVYYPVTNFSEVDAAIEGFIQAQVSTLPVTYQQDAALEMDYTASLLGDKLGQVKLFGFTGTVVDQPEKDAPLTLTYGLVYDAATGAVLGYDDLIAPGQQEAFAALLSEQTGYSCDILSKEALLYAAAFGEDGLHFTFAPGSLSETQEQPLSTLVSWEALADYAATPLFDLLGEAYLPTPGRKLDPNKPMIAFTFDDGPSKFSDDIAALFEQYDGRATFFVVGNRIENFDEVFRRVVSGGHEIGNHTWEHMNLRKAGYSDAVNSVKKNNDLIAQYTGSTPAILRPVGGDVNDQVRQLSKELHLALINWNVDTQDWRSHDADSIYQECVRATKDGSIVLFHDLYESTYEAVQRLVPYYAEQGYQLVTVSELIAYSENPEFTYGVIYRGESETK